MKTQKNNVQIQLMMNYLDVYLASKKSAFFLLFLQCLVLQEIA